ncbi:MAG TPA: 16S rRNA (cytosine(967)-C(5))-methyltransferase RsmB [Candidatus Paceibacterota bacterium]|nr:16S rRNA (cytosine(967)-C(5))-methyltransferase RsmB [Candidatus Paceibacterota bacterium]
MNDEKPREIAVKVLLKRLSGSDYVENLLDQALAQSRLSSADRGLCQELVYGVARWQLTLDWLIERKTPGRTQKPMLQSLLRLGLYQIFWLDRIPNHAAVHETVEQAKRNGFGPQAGFVNAILRGYLREFDATRQLLEDLKNTQPHIGYSHPQWLVDRWTKRWGVEKTAQLLEWNNTPPKTYARINSLMFGKDALASTAAGRLAVANSGRQVIPSSVGRPFLERTFKDAGDVLAQWRDEGIEYDFVRKGWLVENLMFELKSHPPLAKLASFQRGLFYVQDPSTLLAVNELDPQPGETILDLCAAPGGKTTYMAQRMENRGKIVAHDNSPDRLKMIRENCSRLGVTCVETVGELSGPGFSTQNPTFDRILIDAPCSNTGVMRRRVDLRWRIRPEEIDRLRSTQLELLNRATRFLKPGGTVVYSTCSLEPEENGELVDRYLETSPKLQKVLELQLLPPKDCLDGAYATVLQLER